MNCPKCQSSLEATTGQYNVLRCSNCQGLWFSAEDFRQLRSNEWMVKYILDVGKASKGRKFDKVRDVSCPECNATMTQTKDDDQPHITYETCPNGHGAFFDAGEFKDLVHDEVSDKFKDLLARKK